MPYLEKLKEIRDRCGLSNSQIAIAADVSEPTVSRIFNGQTKLSQFETLARMAIVMGASLDEIAGLKSADAPAPIVEQTMTNYAELLKEKDDRIEAFKAEIAHYRKQNNRLVMAVVVLAAFFVAVLLFDIFSGHFGYFRY